METTANYELKKPGMEDYSLITDINENMDTIDAGLKAVKDTAEAAATPADITAAIATKQDTITGAASTIAGSNLTASRAVVSNASGKVGVSDTTAAEIGYVHGVTSGIQEQLDGKVGTLNGPKFSTLAEFVAATAFDNTHKNWAFNFQDTGGWGPLGTTQWYRCVVQYQNTFGGTASVAGNIRIFGAAIADQWIGYITGSTASNVTVVWRRTLMANTEARLTANRVLYAGYYGDLQASDVSNTELGYLSGATRNIQTQLNELTPELTNYNYFLADEKSIPSGAWTDAGSFTITKGMWVIKIAITWDPNSTGSRAAHLADASGGDRINYSTSSLVQAVTGDRTIQEITYFVYTGSSRTFYLVVRQTSGSGLKVATRLNTLRIASA